MNPEEITSIGGDSLTSTTARPIESLLQPFLAQSAPIRSIVSIACHEALNGHGALKLTGAEVPAGTPINAFPDAVLLQLAGEECSTAIRAHLDGENALGSLARQARERSKSLSGYDLLLLPASVLTEMFPPPDRDFSFRAIAVLLHEHTEDWKLRRGLFDRGLICIGAVDVAGGKALCFLASHAVCSFNHLHVASRGHISMSMFLWGAAYGNQLFRYACLKLYALRHGLTPALPAWEGNELFGLQDKACEGLALPRVTYDGFAKNDREIWDQPLVNIDLVGYFQEIPECWRRHRPLLRRLFQLPPEHLEAFDEWRHRVTRGGRRTLVAVHVRRGDYRNFNTPYFRLVPEDWYLDWLRAIWPTLCDPVLFVGTDEPDLILPKFQEFETVSATFGPAGRELSDPVRDFEVLRRADYLAICNSSFGRMAAILAPPTQKCFLASFAAQSFEPYEPWIDPGFWARFEPSDAKPKPAAIFVDVSDLLVSLLNHAALSEVQRVQCEILGNLAGIAKAHTVHFVFLNKRGEMGEIETSALQTVIEDILSGTVSNADLAFKVSSLTGRVFPCSVGPGEVFLSLGAFWNTRGMGAWLQKVKNAGGIIGILIHDLLPVAAPEYFEPRDTRAFAKGVTEALTFADFVFTTSEANKASLGEYLAFRKLNPLPIHAIPMSRGLSVSAPVEPEISRVVAGILKTDYVLSAGTMEVRKNPAYLFNIWKMMVKSGRPNVPYLVFAGRKGWLIQDFLDQLKASGYLGGRILVVHDATELELELLYRKCILTMVPSFVEGFGLAIGESLGHGKVCLCSAAGGIPEGCGDLVEYIDPYNACDGIEKLSSYLDDPALRLRREREIAERFHPRPWVDVAGDLHRTVRAIAAEVVPNERVGAIMLPQNIYLELSNDGAAMDRGGIDGAHSAELICVSGWHPAEEAGVRAAQPSTVIRFRADALPGTKINLVVRLAALGRDFGIRICPGSGGETVLSLPCGSERLRVLACQVEPGNLVTVQFSSVGATLDGDEFPGASYWMLKGILYFDPKRTIPATLGESSLDSARRSG